MPPQPVRAYDAAMRQVLLAMTLLVLPAMASAEGDRLCPEGQRELHVVEKTEAGDDTLSVMCLPARLVTAAKSEKPLNTAQTLAEGAEAIRRLREIEAARKATD